MIRFGRLPRPTVLRSRFGRVPAAPLYGFWTAIESDVGTAGNDETNKRRRPLMLLRPGYRDAPSVATDLGGHATGIDSNQLEAIARSNEESVDRDNQ